MSGVWVLKVADRYLSKCGLLATESQRNAMRFTCKAAAYACVHSSLTDWRAVKLVKRHGRPAVVVSRRPPCICGAAGEYSERWDSFYCPESGVWLEDECGCDANKCGFCGRPKRATKPASGNTVSKSDAFRRRVLLEPAETLAERNERYGREEP